MSKPVFMVSVCSSVKIKGRDCGTINGHDESSSIRALIKDAREVLAYFHERRSLNNFHRDRVITFEQIAE
ncbi:hypothetical protein DTL34_23375 [Escherichia coli]|nr:hypothetical protein DTL34_23375 [Escherichia coli]